MVETLSTTGFGDHLPFTNELTDLFSIVVMAAGVVLLTQFIARVIRDTPPRRTSRSTTTW